MSRKLIYLLSFVLVLGLSVGTVNADIATGLVGHWMFDEGSGSTAFDASGNGNHGTLYGGPTWMAGKVGPYSLDFDGVNDYVDCGNAASLNITRQVTLAAWVNTNDLGTNQNNDWFGKGDTSYMIKGMRTNYQIEFFIYDRGTWITTYYVTDASFNNVWHHVAGTYDGSVLKIYIEGVLKATKAYVGFINSNTYKVYIGQNSEASGRFCDTRIDDARIYNRALTQPEIEVVMTGETPLKVHVPTPADEDEITTTNPLIEWYAGAYAADVNGHHVYFDTDFDDVNDGTGGSDKGLISDPCYPVTGLTPGTTYYWRIDEVNDLHPDKLWRGDVWSFTVGSLTAYNPDPLDGAVFVDLQPTLSWNKGIGKKASSLYFGTNPAALVQKTTIVHDPNLRYSYTLTTTLPYETVHYWKVKQQDLSNVWHDGDIWSFTTTRPGGGLKGSYYNGTAFDTLVLGRSDPQINFDWGADSPALGVDTDNFSVRWTGKVEIPFSGTWTFYTYSKDGVRLWVNNELIIDKWAYRYTACEDWSDPIELDAGKYPIKMEYYATDGDSVAELRWEGPKTSKQLIPQAAFSLPLTASSPNPPDGATDVSWKPTLSWMPGMKADKHLVYLDPNEQKVKDRSGCDVNGVEHTDPSYPITTPLDFDTTYYWAIDEVNEPSVWPGDVWRFTVGDFITVDDFEDYDDIDNLIFNTWLDYSVNNTGMTVGYLPPTAPPYAERTIVHSGRQSMYMHYDNDGTINESTEYQKTGTLLYSEAERQWTDAQDWTRSDVNSLTLWFRGIPASVGSFTAGPPIIMTAAGADIWDTADQFHYAYKQLSGNGSITAKVVSVSNTNASAKAGVMIRETLAANSAHAMVVVQPSNGVAFQRRPSLGAASVEVASQTGIIAPQWVRLTRSGNSFTAESSANGTTWTTLGSVDMPMLLDVYVGLCLTSHDAALTCTAEFSNVTTNGTGDWQSQDIGIQSNVPEGLYVVLQDSAGISSPPVKNSDPAATTLNIYTPWNIPLTSFTGQATAGSAQTSVNLQTVKKLTIGVGDRANTQPSGSGDLYIDDIGLKLP